MSQLKYLAPVAALAVTGCLASKADIVLLQDEIRTLRAMHARADTARRVQIDSIAASVAALNEQTADSLRALSQRFAAFQANVGGEFYEIGRQLITIQELAGMSSARIMELRSAMEERAQTLAPADTVPVPPGPAQLFQAAYQQMTRGSHSAARAGFEELLRAYPDFDRASLALLYIGQTFAQEGRTAEADSVYSQVVVRFPRSPDAATALYKYGVSQLTQGRTAAGRTALERVIKDFPSSTEAELAADRLRSIR